MVFVFMVHSNKTTLVVDNSSDGDSTRISTLSEWTFSTPGDNLSRDKCEANQRAAAAATMAHIERVYDGREFYTPPENRMSWDECELWHPTARMNRTLPLVISGVCSTVDLIWATENFWHIPQPIDGEKWATEKCRELLWRTFTHFDIFTCVQHVCCSTFRFQLHFHESIRFSCELKCSNDVERNM